MSESAHVDIVVVVEPAFSSRASDSKVYTLSTVNLKFTFVAGGL